MRRGRETRGARAPSHPAGCPPQVWNSRIRETVQQDVTPQFFLHETVSSVDILLLFDSGCVLTKSRL
jgi:hypothetical protein